MATSQSANQSKKQNVKFLHNPSNFSAKELIIFALGFGLVAGYVLWKIFAAGPLIATLQSEQMKLPSGASVIQDTTAAGGQAIRMPRTGRANGQVALPGAANSLTVMAKATKCGSYWPKMTIYVDGTKVLSATVTSTAWRAFPANRNIVLGTHTLGLAYSSPSSSVACKPVLFFDVSYFYGNSPGTVIPTISLSASPATVSTGNASTLTWNSTNATSCTASGAWSGSKAVSGSSTTGALNASSTYTLSCAGSGGTATASATVTVAGAVPPPAPPPPAPPPSGSGCNKVLGPSDNLQSAVDAAVAGTSICLAPGVTYNTDLTLARSHGNSTISIGITSADRSNPSTINGRIVTKPGGDYFQISHLKLRFSDTSGQGLPSPTIGSDHISLLYNDISTNQTTICINTLNSSQYGTAHNTTIFGNRIHNCGPLPATNHAHGVYDSGYYTIIANNYIYGNADRGVQLRGAQGAVVTHNVVDRNGEGVIFGDLSASNNAVFANIFSNSNIRFNAEYYWNGGTVGSGNTFSDNCLWSTRTDYYGTNQSIQPGMTGVSLSNNIFASPQFVNAGAGDYRIPGGGTCAGYGVQAGITVGP